jgi:hypothetical protein
MIQEHPFPVEANDTPATQLLHDALPQRWRGLFTAPIVNRFLTWTDAEARVQAAAQKVGAQIVTVGESREHRPLHLYRFGKATRRTFWYAGPHANEPVGVSTVVSLAEALAAHPEYLDTIGFDLMVCVDPDSHVANEHWFPG